ncbi:serine protease domain protein, partial [Vibrio parahaemolyticus VP-48]
REVRSHIE